MLDVGLKIAQILAIIGAGAWAFFAFLLIQGPDREAALRQAAQKRLEVVLKTHVRIADERSAGDGPSWIDLNVEYRNLGQAPISVTAIKCQAYGGSLSRTAGEGVDFGSANRPHDNDPLGVIEWTEIGTETDWLDGVAPKRSNQDGKMVNEPSNLLAGASEREQRTFLVNGQRWAFVGFSVTVWYEQEKSGQMVPTHWSGFEVTEVSRRGG